MRKIIIRILLALVGSYSCIAAADDKSAKPEALSGYLIDSAPTSVSAASFLGAADVTNIQNAGDIGGALKALSNDGTKSSLALSFTPARSALTPMDLTTYKGITNRFIGALTFGYAQGDTTISNATYSRQAYSVESNIYIYEEDDPISKLRSEDCDVLSPQIPLPPPKDDKERKAREDDRLAKFAQKWEECKKAIKTRIPWNAATFAIGYAKGYIKPTTGTADQISLGETIYVGVTLPLGPKLEKPDSQLGWQLQAAYRKSQNEPILSTLGTTSVAFKDSSTSYLQIKGGTNKARGLIQVSNVKEVQTSTSTATFKRAVGIDYNVANGAWLIFRFGRKLQANNGKEEASSMLSLNISPTLLLK